MRHRTHESNHDLVCLPAGLVEGIIKRGIIGQISCETVRRILKTNSIRFQRTKTWEESKDPAFQEKWRRVKALYREKPPEDTAVLCLDEFGPIELRPYAGDHWAPEKHPQRLPATYNRHHGVRHLLAYYDVHANVLDGRVYERKRGEKVLDFLQWIHNRYGEKRLIIVLDNFSPHRRKDVREWAEANRMELVFIATNASWMNRIECHFAALKKFVLGGSYPKSHDECAAAIREARLQTIIRRSKNQIAQRRATILLEHMLGADVDYLADQYAIPVEYLRQLIDAFERKGIDAVHEGTRTKAHSISPEESSLVVEMVRLTPRAFGIDRDTWLLSQLRDLAVEQNSLRVVDLDGIRSALTDAKLPYQDDLL